MPNSATSGRGEAVCGSFFPLLADWLCVAVWSLLAAAPAFWPAWSEVEAALPDCEAFGSVLWVLLAAPVVSEVLGGGVEVLGVVDCCVL